MSEHVFANIINVKHHYSDQSLPHVLLYNVGGKLNTWHEVFYEDVFFLSLVTTFILFII